MYRLRQAFLVVGHHRGLHLRHGRLLLQSAGHAGAAAAPAGAASKRELFVSNVHPTVTEAALLEAFQKHGKCQVKLMVDRSTRKRKDFGFVSFESEAAAEAALKELDGHVLSGQAMKLKRNEPRSRPPPSSPQTSSAGGAAAAVGLKQGRPKLPSAAPSTPAAPEAVPTSTSPSTPVTTPNTNTNATVLQASAPPARLFGKYVPTAATPSSSSSAAPTKDAPTPPLAGDFSLDDDFSDFLPPKKPTSPPPPAAKSTATPPAAATTTAGSGPSLSPIPATSSTEDALSALFGDLDLEESKAVTSSPPHPSQRTYAPPLPPQPPQQQSQPQPQQAPIQFMAAPTPSPPQHEQRPTSVLQWTKAQTLEWLQGLPFEDAEDVEQAVEVFRYHKVNGATLAQYTVETLLADGLPRGLAVFVHQHAQAALK